MRGTVLLCLLLSSLAVAAWASDLPADAKNLQGKWNGVSLELNGTKAPADELKGGAWSFVGDKVRFHSPSSPGASDKADFKIDPSKTPKELDLVGEAKGQKLVFRGIYALEKDRLTICLRTPDAEEKGRPKEFATSAGSGLALLVFERAK